MQHNMNSSQHKPSALRDGSLALSEIPINWPKCLQGAFVSDCGENAIIVSILCLCSDQQQRLSPRHGEKKNAAIVDFCNVNIEFEIWFMCQYICKHENHWIDFTEHQEIFQPCVRPQN